MRKATQNHAQHEASTMSWNLERALQYTVFVVLAVILFCLVLLTPSDAIYQCYVTQRLTNIFIITGGYVVTFLLTALIYATRIYTNRTVLSGIPKAWIPIEKEDVGKSVRRLVVEGLARSAIIAYQARPRDPAADAEADAFDEYPMLQIDAARPPWGAVEHPGWSAPHSPDLPDLPYRTVVQELPHLIEAKAVSLAPPDPFFLATRPRSRPPYPPGRSLHPSSAHDNDTEHSIPDTRIVDVLRRPAGMGLREYLQRLAQLDVLHPAEIGAEFLGLYERARFSAHALHEAEFRSLMHVFADLLRGMRLADPAAVEGEIYGGGGSRVDSESLIGPSDEEGETDAMEYRGGREEASRPSDVSSAWDEGRSVYATPVESSSRWGSRQGQSQYQAQAQARLRPQSSTRSLQRMQSGSSSGSVIHLVETRDATELPYAYG